MADADGDAGREERFRERRGLYLSPWLNGLVRADGDFDPEGGQVVISAVRAHVDADARATTADARTPAQRRADALVKICRRYLNASDRPTTAGERPHLVVHVDLEALEGRAGRRCELDDAGVVTPEAARRVACDASLSRVITRGGSEPLEVGRRTPIVPAALRRALVVRDGGCRFPGCERPHAWCDAHHVRHWADGGETSLGNLVLLCRAHHRLVHGRFRLQIIEGEPAFTRPDGTRIADRAPPRVAALTG